MSTKRVWKLTLTPQPSHQGFTKLSKQGRDCFNVPRNEHTRVRACTRGQSVKIVARDNTPGSFPPAISIHFFFFVSFFFSFASSSHSALLRNRVSRQPAHTLSYFSLSLSLSLSLLLFANVHSLVSFLSHRRSRDLENCRVLRNVVRRWRQQSVPRTQFRRIEANLLKIYLLDKCVIPSGR